MITSRDDNHNLETLREALRKMEHNLLWAETASQHAKARADLAALAAVMVLLTAPADRYEATRQKAAEIVAAVVFTARKLDDAEAAPSARRAILNMHSAVMAAQKISEGKVA